MCDDLPAKLDLGPDYEEHLAFQVRRSDGTSSATVPSTLAVSGDEGVLAVGRATIEPGGRFERRALASQR